MPAYRLAKPCTSATHAIDDIEGANAAGMASVWVKLAGSSEQPRANATVTSLTELPGAIARLSAPQGEAPI